MEWQKNCAVVIPCFDEGATINSIVLAVREHLPTVVVVDDGSHDRTAAEAEAAGAMVVRHATNLGKGAALKTGLGRALQGGCGWAITLDGDGQHRPRDIRALLACAEQTGAALVSGNRMHQAEAMPWLRRRVNRWMSRRISQCTGRCLPDTQCGFRLVDLDVWASLTITRQRFEVESEMLEKILGAGHRVEFVPIQVVGRGPRSHISPLRDGWRWLRWWRAALRANQQRTCAARPRLAIGASLHEH